MKKIIQMMSMKFQQFNRYYSYVRFFLNSWRFESYGYRCGLEKGLRILGNPIIKMGNNVMLRSNIIIIGNGFLEIGSNTCINDQVIIDVTKKISIGDNCMIAPRVYIADVDHKFEGKNQPIAFQGYLSKDILICNDVWIGANCFITKGVKIESGVVVGANSVVTKNINKNSVVGGVPTRYIKNRFYED